METRSDALPRKKWYSTKEAAVYLGYSPGTLRVYRSQGRGPKFETGHGGRPRYNRVALDAWLTNKKTR